MEYEYGMNSYARGFVQHAFDFKDDWLGNFGILMHIAAVTLSQFSCRTVLSLYKIVLYFNCSLG